MMVCDVINQCANWPKNIYEKIAMGLRVCCIDVCNFVITVMKMMLINVIVTKYLFMLVMKMVLDVVMKNIDKTVIDDVIYNSVIYRNKCWFTVAFVMVMVDNGYEVTILRKFCM